MNANAEHEQVDPRWITAPVTDFVLTLLLIGVGLLMGEHRSLMRRKDPRAQATMPVWKMAITWNLIPLVGFMFGVILSLIALNGIEFDPVCVNFEYHFDK
jgi:hypothetical protein